MSGGSFNYLCHKDAGDLMNGGCGDLNDMVDELTSLGYAEDAARETASIVAEVNAARIRIEAKLERLNGVWHGMEWWRSGDWEEAKFKRELAEYRGTNLPTCSRCTGSGREPGTSMVACQNPGCASGKDTAGV